MVTADVCLSFPPTVFLNGMLTPSGMLTGHRGVTEVSISKYYWTIKIFAFAWVPWSVRCIGASGVIDLSRKKRLCGSLSSVFSNWNFNKPGTWYFFFFPLFLEGENCSSPKSQFNQFLSVTLGKWCCFLCLSLKWFRCPELYPKNVCGSFISMEKVHRVLFLKEKT